MVYKFFFLLQWCCYTGKSLSLFNAVFELWLEFMIYFCSINRQLVSAWRTDFFDSFISKICWAFFCSLQLLMLCYPYLFTLSSS